MELAELVAWGLFAVIFAFLGMVLGATWKQMQDEARAAGVVRRADERRREKQWIGESSDGGARHIARRGLVWRAAPPVRVGSALER